MDDNDKREIKGVYVNLREHFEILWIERCKNIELQFQATAQALILSKSELDNRLKELNNLRLEYTQDRITDSKDFLRTDVYFPKMDALDTWIKGVDAKFTTIETRQRTWTVAVGVIFILMQIGIAFLIKVWK